MLVFLWMCVAASAFVPNGDRMVTYYTAAIENYFDSVIGQEELAPPAKVRRAA